MGFLFNTNPILFRNGLASSTKLRYMSYLASKSCPNKKKDTGTLPGIVLSSTNHSFVISGLSNLPQLSNGSIVRVGNARGIVWSLKHSTAIAFFLDKPLLIQQGDHVILERSEYLGRNKNPRTEYDFGYQYLNHVLYYLRSLSQKQPSFIKRQRIIDQMMTGISAVDLFYPIGFGSRIGVFGNMRGDNIIAFWEILSSSLHHNSSLHCVYAVSNSYSGYIQRIVSYFKRLNLLERISFFCPEPSEPLLSQYAVFHAASNVSYTHSKENRNVLLVLDDFSVHSAICQEMQSQLQDGRDISQDSISTLVNSAGAWDGRGAITLLTVFHDHPLSTSSNHYRELMKALLDDSVHIDNGGVSWYKSRLRPSTTLHSKLLKDALVSLQKSFHLSQDAIIQGELLENGLVIAESDFEVDIQDACNLRRNIEMILSYRTADLLHHYAFVYCAASALYQAYLKDLAFNATDIFSGILIAVQDRLCSSKFFREGINSEKLLTEEMNGIVKEAVQFLQKKPSL